MAEILQVFNILYNLRYYCVVPVLLTYGVKYYLSYRRLSHINGPWLAAWSSLWLVGVAWRRKMVLEFFDVYKSYGSLVRIGPNELMTSDVEVVYRMNAARSPYVRSEFFLAFRLSPGVDNLFSMRDEKLHAKRKAQLQMAYSGKENIDIESTVDLHLQHLTSLIRRKYVSSSTDFKPMDLARVTQYFSLDAIVDIATGAPFGDLVDDKDHHNYLQSTADQMPVMNMMGTVPSTFKILQIKWIGRLIYPNVTEVNGMGKLIGITEKMVAERFSGDRKIEKSDIMQSFIKHGLTREEVIAESMLQILAGSDTSATAIRAIMLYLMTSYQVYTKLQAEIDQAVKSGTISFPVIKDSEARKLPYLQAVIREGLRILPPAVGTVPRTVPPEGDSINGVFVPGGTNIGTNMWAIMRNTKFWGQDAEVFRPERWLEAPLEKLKNMENVLELVFGYGKWKCLGMNIARMELNKVFFELLRDFDWTVVNPVEPWQSDCLSLWIQKGLYVRITERN